MHVSKGYNLFNKYVYTIYEQKEKHMNQLKVSFFSSTYTSKPCAILRYQGVGQVICISKS